MCQVPSLLGLARRPRRTPIPQANQADVPDTRGLRRADVHSLGSRAAQEEFRMVLFRAALQKLRAECEADPGRSTEIVLEKLRNGAREGKTKINYQRCG